MLHPDVNLNNIQITEDGRGLLMDWDLSKTVEEAGTTRRGRMGTWQFVSGVHIKPFEKDDHPHTLLDNLESFIHVLGWITLQFVPAVDAYLEVYRALDMRKYDDFYIYEGRFTSGPDKRSTALALRYPSLEFHPKRSTPLYDLLNRLASPFGSRYVPPPKEEDRAKLRAYTPTTKSSLTLKSLWLSVNQYDDDMESLQSPTWFIKTIESALQEDGWPSDDKADDSSHKYWTGRSRWRRRNPYDCHAPFELIKKRSASEISEPSRKRCCGTPLLSDSDN